MISPEILVEQVMGYVVWAKEMIPTLMPPAQPYTVVILPQGPHFYTWLLQAAGYLLLDGQKKKMLIISEQYDDLENILIDTNNYEPVFGQTRKSSESKIHTIAHQLKAKIALLGQTTVSENIRFQLPFIRVITQTKEYIHISIGPKTPQSIIQNLLKWIKKNIADYTIVLLQNIEIPLSTKIKKIDEEKKVAKMLTDPKIKTANIVNLFKIINLYIDSKPEVIAYVNPSDFNKKLSFTTRYVCAVG